MNRPTLRISGLSVKYDGLYAVEDLSVELFPEEVTAIVGPNGSGKTTLINAICGFADPTEGSIVLGGVNLSGKKPDQRYWAGIRRTFQFSRAYLNMSLEENLRLAQFTKREESLSRVLRFTTRASRQIVGESIRRHLDKFQIAYDPNQNASKLSFGKRRLLELARCSISRGRAYLLDEPYSGVFPGSHGTISAELRRSAELVAIVVFVEHNMEVVRAVANRVIVMSQGKVIADGTPEVVLASDIVSEAYFGTPIRV